jgi:hypothetical protein
MFGCSHHAASELEPATEEERLHREASHRADQRMGFLQHLAVFIPVMLLILAIDVLAGDEWFIHWVAGIWGGILAIHFLYTYILDDALGPAMYRRLTENQLRRLEERSRRGG